MDTRSETDVHAVRTTSSATDEMTGLIKPYLGRAILAGLGMVGGIALLFFLWPHLSAVFSLQNQFKDNVEQTEKNTASIASAWDRISKLEAEVSKNEQTFEARAGKDEQQSSMINWRIDHDPDKAKLETRQDDEDQRLKRLEAWRDSPSSAR